MTVEKLIAELTKLNRPKSQVRVSFDSDNAAGTVKEVYISSDADCARAMLAHNEVTLRID